jgi:hypothetical protein
MPHWDFIIGDRFGNPLAELTNATAREVYLPLSRIATGNFTVQTNNPNVNLLRSMDQVTIKTYRDGILMTNGPCVPSYNKSVSATSRTVQFNFASAGWRLARRIIPSSKSVAGVTYPADLATNPNDTTDIGAMAVAMINDCNTEVLPAGVTVMASDTGVRIGVVGVMGNTSVGPWNYKNALQGISDVSALLNGFDWLIEPTEALQDELGVQFGLFNAQLALGQIRPNVWFEYGDGKANVSAFTEVGDVSAVGNRFYSLPSGFPGSPATDVITDLNVSAINNSGVIYEDTLSNDLTTVAAQQQLVDENLLIRAFPRIVITFQPTVDQTPGVIPQYGTDFFLGDAVGFRAVEYGNETVNGYFRLYACKFDIDDQGNEIMTPTLLSSDVSDVITTSPVGV